VGDGIATSSVADLVGVGWAWSVFVLLQFLALEALDSVLVVGIPVPEASKGLYNIFLVFQFLLFFGGFCFPRFIAGSLFFVHFVSLESTSGIVVSKRSNIFLID
jgi:hypothetical protein